MGCSGLSTWRARIAALIVSTTFLAGCGGGGGGSPSSATGTGDTTGTASGGAKSSAPAFSATVSNGSTSNTFVAGTQGSLDFTLSLAFTGSGTVYFLGAADPTLVSALSGSQDGHLIDMHLNPSTTLAPGNYASTFYIYACRDTACSTEVSGSPVAIPIAFTVYSNIQVQPSLSLQRTGNAPAPSASLPVTAPPAAGPLVLTVNNPANVFSAAFDGNKLTIGTTQARAGTYTGQFTLTGAQDGRFTRTVAVTYTVSPPPGGEQALAVTPLNNDLVVAQGSSASTLLTLTPPTWTNVIDPPVVKDSTGMLSISALGNNTYRLTVNAVGEPPGDYLGSVSFSAGATGGTAVALASWDVVSTIYPLAIPTLNIDPATTPAGLIASTQIATFDGAPAIWSATTTTPWLNLTHASGTTGKDALTMNFDPKFFASNPGSFTGSIALSSNRPGTKPQAIPVSVNSTLPLVQRTSAVLTGTSGRLYIQGQFAADLGQLQSLGAIQISGATISGQSYRTDQRFLNLLRELVLDVSNAVPGTPIVIKAQVPLASSQVTVAVRAPTKVTPGFSTLPYASYRSAGFAPGQDAFYFSAPGELLRWAEAAGQWTLTQATATGLSGLALRPDEQYLYGVQGTSVLRFDPVTLVVNAVGGPFIGFDTPAQGNTIVDQFDPDVPSLNSSLVFASDARAIASNEGLSGGVAIYRSANWIAAPPLDSIADLTVAPQIADVGNGPWGTPNLPSGIGLVASPNHHVVAGTTSQGQVALYASSSGLWSAGPSTVPGTLVVGVSDDANRLVRSDGTVVDGSGTSIGNLNSVVPFTHHTGGFALTQDGHYGVVYGYALSTANGLQSASGATLWVVDLSQAPSVPLSSKAIAATVALKSPVGCTATVLAPGETCVHTASISVAPGSASAFVLGPRGVAAVPLPSPLGVAVSAALPTRAERLPSEPLPMLRRPIGTFTRP